MSDQHDLPRLPFPAVRGPVHFPRLAIANPVTGSPEFGCHAGVMSIPVEPSDFAVSNFTRDFHAETEIFSQVINAPAHIGVQQNAIVCAGASL